MAKDRKKHVPAPARDPRPKGSQKGIIMRDGQQSGPEVRNTRTPWLFSGKSRGGRW